MSAQSLCWIMTCAFKDAGLIPAASIRMNLRTIASGLIYWLYEKPRVRSGRGFQPAARPFLWL